MKSGKQFQLPEGRKKSFVEIISELNRKKLIGAGVLLYIGTVFIFSVVESFLHPETHIANNHLTVSFLDLIYFNFISILTIGYGDLAPTGIFRVLTVIEAMAGLAIYGLVISIITIKVMLPGKHTIVFSKYAYYCLDDHSFMIIYLNTATQFLTNVETSWYFKLGEDWKTLPPIKVPFITKSVQTFYLSFLPMKDIKPKLHYLDCLRVGISGSLGMSTYSTFVEYGLSDILIVPNRAELTAYDGFYQVDEFINTEKFQHYFHYHPKDAVKMASLI